MKRFTLKDHLIYNDAGKPIDIKPSLPEWVNRNNVERLIIEEWGVYSDPEDPEEFPVLTGIQEGTPDTVMSFYEQYLEREKNKVLVSLEEEAECDFSRWGYPPGITTTISEPTPEQRALAKEINAQRAAEKR